MKTILIGIDGLRPDGLLYANTPNINNLIKSNKCCFNYDVKIKNIPLSAPSWASTLSGKSQKYTGIESNEQILKKNFELYSSDIFTYLNKNNINVYSIISHWKNMKVLTKHCKEKVFINETSVKLSDYKAIDKANQKIKDNNLKKNNFVFLYLNSIDITGHKHGFSIQSNKYIKSIETLDKMLSTLIKNCLKHKWNIIITTDHGGTNHFNHKLLKKKRYSPQKMYKGIHFLNTPQHTRIFQIYYGDIFTKYFLNSGGDIIENLNNTSIYKVLKNIYNYE